MNLDPRGSKIADALPYPDQFFLNSVVGQTMPNGLQRIVRITWSNRPKTYSNNREQQWNDRYATIKGAGTLKIEVAGDATEPDIRISTTCLRTRYLLTYEAARTPAG